MTHTDQHTCMFCGYEKAHIHRDHAGPYCLWCPRCGRKTDSPDILAQVFDPHELTWTPASIAAWATPYLIQVDGLVCVGIRAGKDLWIRLEPDSPTIMPVLPDKFAVIPTLSA